MSLIVLALVLWIVVVPALVVLGALYLPRGLLHRLGRSSRDDATPARVTRLKPGDSAGLSRQSA